MEWIENTNRDWEGIKHYMYFSADEKWEIRGCNRTGFVRLDNMVTGEMKFFFSVEHAKRFVEGL